jgi:putative methyltransferase (TIGR04325 family)
MMKSFAGTFEEAERASGSGYAATDLAKLVVEKTQRIAKLAVADPVWSSVPALLAALIPILGRRSFLRVLDFGGAAGFQYFDMRLKYPEIATRWAVVETPSMAAAADLLASDSLQFFTEIAAAAHWLGDVDLVHANGVLQYLGDAATALEQLTRLGALGLIFPRAMCRPAGPVVAIQSSRLIDHGPGVAPAGTPDRVVLTPLVLRPIDTYVSLVAPRYRLRARIPDFTGQDDLDGSPITAEVLFFEGTKQMPSL